MKSHEASNLDIGWRLGHTAGWFKKHLHALVKDLASVVFIRSVTKNYNA